MASFHSSQPEFGHGERKRRLISDLGLATKIRKTIGKEHDKKKSPRGREWAFEEFHMASVQALVLESDFELLSFLDCTSKETEQVVKLVWEAFPLLSNRLDLITYYLNVETSGSLSSATLFRGVSMCTKMVSHFMREYGGDYLSKFLSSLVEELSSPDAPSIEVDPLKLQCNEEGDKEKVLAENLENFQKCVERIITLILEKSNLISKDLRNVLKLCRGIVLEKYPQMGKQLVGGFFFLRFVCPFLVAPSTLTLTSSGRRRMILVSKVIQNLSNGLLFGEKEKFMIPLNSLLEKLQPSVNTFLDEISSNIVGESKDKGELPNDVMSEGMRGSLEEIFTELKASKENIQQQLNSSKGDQEVETNDDGSENANKKTVVDPQILQRLVDLFDEIENSGPISPRALSPRALSPKAIRTPKTPTKLKTNILSPPSSATRKRKRGLPTANEDEGEAPPGSPTPSEPTFSRQVTWDSGASSLRFRNLESDRKRRKSNLATNSPLRPVKAQSEGEFRKGVVRRFDSPKKNQQLKMGSPSSVSTPPVSHILAGKRDVIGDYICDTLREDINGGLGRERADGTPKRRKRVSGAAQLQKEFFWDSTASENCGNATPFNESMRCQSAKHLTNLTNFTNLSPTSTSTSTNTPTKTLSNPLSPKQTMTPTRLTTRRGGVGGTPTKPMGGTSRLRGVNF